LVVRVFRISDRQRIQMDTRICRQKNYAVVGSCMNAKKADRGCISGGLLINGN